MDQAKTRFSASQHGFRFQNSFELPFPQKYNLPFVGTVDIRQVVIGLCGGMCFAALDYYYANQQLPPEKEVRKIDRGLFNYLCQRQLDSLQIPVVFRVIEWMLASDPVLTSRVLRYHLPRLRAMLEKGEPAILGLIRVAGLSDPTKNHQVLATGFSVNPQTRQVHISVYDPNHPQKDVVISVSRSNGEPRFSQSTGEPLRGFFIIPYKPIRNLPPIPNRTLNPPEETS